MTRKLPKQQRVDQILEAAVAEFLERGYEGASVDSIARRAGLTKGGIYHHFGSKDAILLAANDRFYEPVVALAMEAMGDPSPDAGLRRYMRRSLRHWADHPEIVAFTFLSWSKMLALADIGPMTNQYLQQALGFFEGMLQRGIQAGVYREHDTRTRALALMNALDGVSVYLVTGDLLTPEGVAEDFARLFLDEIRRDR